MSASAGGALDRMPDGGGAGSGTAHAAEPHDHAPHGTLKGYITGFVLSVILTAIPFWLVMGDALGSKPVTAVVIMALAAVQIVVHMIYFLHMDAKVESGWSLMALLFTIILVVIALAGSLWVMYHLNANMMPGMQDMGELP